MILSRFFSKDFERNKKRKGQKRFFLEEKIVFLGLNDEMIDGRAPIITPSYQSLSLALSILAHSRKTLHESSKILVEHALLDAPIQFRTQA